MNNTKMAESNFFKPMAFKYNRECQDKKKFEPNNSNERVCKYFKTLSLFFCLVAFLLTNWKIFQNFREDRNVISTRIESSRGNVLELPTILLCNSSAFKEPVLYSDPDQYKNNTLSLDDFMVDAYLLKNLSNGIFEQHPISIKDNFKPVITLLRGMCYMNDNKTRVGPSDVIWLELSTKLELQLYIIEPGNEIFIPADTWVQDPQMMRLKKDHSYVEMKLQKQTVSLRPKTCKSTEGYDYGVCVAKEFKKIYEMDNTFSRCSVPWTTNLTGIDMNLSKQSMPCNTSEASVQAILLIDFFTKASLYSLPECKVPCSSTTYGVKSREYGFDSIIIEHIKHSYKERCNISTRENIKTKSVWISFPSADILLSEEIGLNDVYDFISSIGGNLGLFIGFSFLSLLISTAEGFKKLCEANISM